MLRSKYSVRQTRSRNCVAVTCRLWRGNNRNSVAVSQQPDWSNVTIRIIKSTFQGASRDGDFAWMIDQVDFARTLFLFNDNEAQFYEHQRKIDTAHSCHPGGGNAIIRPYECVQPPRATGIPTGQDGGYRSLSAKAKTAIDNAIGHLDALLATGDYDSIAISWNEHSQTLGTGIFDVDQAVLNYIVDQIEATAERH